MSTRYLYSARLVPIGKPVRIPFVENDRPPELTTFDDSSFELERTAKTKPPVCLNHDKNLQIGRVGVLTRDGGWWCADFLLDADIPDDIEFEVGQSVSVGVHQSTTGSGGIFLDEVSIVRHAAVKGAEITRRFALEPKPAEPPRAPAAVVSSSKPTAVGEVIPIRRASQRPTAFPRSEFDRRWAFAADLYDAGINGVFEAELEHMQRLELAMQLGRMPSPSLRQMAGGR